MMVVILLLLGVTMAASDVQPVLSHAVLGHSTGEQ